MVKESRSGPAATHVALFRGLNVGRAKRVAMADLRAMVTRLGHHDVRTLLNSGNVVFTLTRAARGDPALRIEKALAVELGVSSRVTVLTAEELAAVVRGNPLLALATDPRRLLVAVLARPGDRSRLEPLARQDWTPDVLAIGTRASYLWCSGGILGSRLAVAVGRTLKDAATTRNWATVTKLHALMGNGG